MFGLGVCTISKRTIQDLSPRPLGGEGTNSRARAIIAGTDLCGGGGIDSFLRSVETPGAELRSASRGLNPARGGRLRRPPY